MRDAADSVVEEKFTHLFGNGEPHSGLSRELTSRDMSPLLQQYQDDYNHTGLVVTSLGTSTKLTLRCAALVLRWVTVLRYTVLV